MLFGFMPGCLKIFCPKLNLKGSSLIAQKALLSLHTHTHTHTDHGSHDIHGHREEDGGASLSSDGVQGLQVAQLQGRGRAVNHVSRLLQRARGIQLTLSCNKLEKEREAGSSAISRPRRD